MSNVLAIGFLALLCIDAAGAVLCLFCNYVGIDNICINDEKTCESGDWKFCYVKVLVSGGLVRRVSRGCSASCINTTTRPVAYKSRMICCETEFCNDYDIWNG